MILNSLSKKCSHLFQRVASFLHQLKDLLSRISPVCSHLFQRVASFLPKFVQSLSVEGSADVLISFREWLHSYTRIYATRTMSYGTRFSSLSESGFIPTSFFSSPLTWGLHLFSSLSESGFIPTELPRYCSCNSGTGVLISFREWLHSYKK